MARLAELAAPYGARIELLADGTIAAFLDGGEARDQAAGGARLALELRALYPEKPLALATGRAERRGVFPVGEVIDAAVELLRRASGAPPPHPLVDDEARV